MNLIAEREGIEARAQKRWDKFLGEFGSVETTPSWALARMYATPYCSPNCSSCFFCDDTTHITCPECGVYQCAMHASGFCPSEICVALRKWRVQFTATLACIVLAFALGDRLVGNHLNPSFGFFSLVGCSIKKFYVSCASHKNCLYIMRHVLRKDLKSNLSTHRDINQFINWELTHPPPKNDVKKSKIGYLHRIGHAI